MAMSATGLAGEIKAKLDALFGPATDPGIQGDVLKAIAEAVVDHIKDNAVVTLDSDSVSVPAAGLVAPNGPVTGSANGTLAQDTGTIA